MEEIVETKDMDKKAIGTKSQNNKEETINKYLKI